MLIETKIKMDDFENLASLARVFRNPYTNKPFVTVAEIDKNQQRKRVKLHFKRALVHKKYSKEESNELQEQKLG